MVPAVRALLTLLLLLAGCIPSLAKAQGSRKLLQDDAYVCIRPLNLMPGDWLDTTALVHCYLQEGGGESPAWSIAYDDDGTHAEVDTDHSKRECHPVTGASLAAVKDSAYVQIRDGPWLADDYEVLDNNCCHFIDQILLGAGSLGVEDYFPDYSLPSWEPRD